ncbi:hypothetical protein NPIL_256731 [Nephila pilipes]|uniref:Uncharacterized protein n=1 Tax=Nephila pilipes TaxID=299642 RepID=A0A8X6QP54_NEPPI|nr:hypothetical protein NPIL_256731 [Nephila pilipes]
MPQHKIAGSLQPVGSWTEMIQTILMEEVDLAFSFIGLFEDRWKAHSHKMSKGCNICQWLFVKIYTKSQNKLEIDASHSLCLTDLRGVFLILVVGYSFPFTALLVEVVYSRIQRKTDVLQRIQKYLI